VETILGPDGAQHLPPALPVHAVKTYSVHAPRRRATCEEYRCRNYLDGWRTIVPADKAPLVRGLGGYSFTEQAQEGGLVEFTFPAGQECFAGRAGQHQMPWEGRERFIERGGDWRGNPRGDVVQHSPSGWVNSFGEHQLKLAERLERG